MRFFKLLPAFAMVSASALPAFAEDGFWSYKDWNVSAEEVDTGEDLRVTCTISTGGDGDPVLSATITNGDVLPPDAYPDISFEEHAPRHYPVATKPGKTVVFAFDEGSSVETIDVDVGIDEEGLAFAVARVPQDESLNMLQAMRRNGEIEIGQQSNHLYTASLSGFTAAYGKMAEACGFSTTGVID